MKIDGRLVGGAGRRAVRDQDFTRGAAVLDGELNTN